MIRPKGIDNGAFVVSSDSVRVLYTLVLLLFSAAAATDTESKTSSKSFDCHGALVSTMKTFSDPENGYYLHYTYPFPRMQIACLD